MRDEMAPAADEGLLPMGFSLAAGLTLLQVVLSKRREVELLCDANEYLEGAHFLIGACPVSVLDLAGSVLVCMRYRLHAFQGGQSRSWLEMLLACCLMQFGGTTLTGMVLGQAPSWIVSHSAIPAMLLAFYLTFYCPADVYWCALQSAAGRLAFLPAASVLSSISSAHAVTSWGQDKALFNTFHVNFERISQSVFVCILCGTLSGCGGGILADCMSLMRPSPLSFSWSPPTLLQSTPEGTAAALVLTRSFFWSCIYYVLLHPLRLQAPPQWMPFSLVLPLSGISTGTYTRPQAHLAITLLSLLHLGVTSLLSVDPSYRLLSRLVRGFLKVGDSWGDKAAKDAAAASCAEHNAILGVSPRPEAREKEALAPKASPKGAARRRQSLR